MALDCFASLAMTMGGCFRSCFDRLSMSGERKANYLDPARPELVEGPRAALSAYFHPASRASIATVEPSPTGFATAR
ncbi:hypothetical protein BV97_00868 [Novosphingobium resinovorum]|uniref:Uncharacterized protein n=1 Tax=Novosphingobium resinovorum TaxID=158500 RepID=A0A031K115_9SPHN|nr:hypothetical protein BV97_00868 [Novosphingobium resinovorum]